MPKKSISIRVPKIHGERGIILANKLEIINKELAIQRNKNSIYIPLDRQPSESELKMVTEQIPDFEVLTYMFQQRKRRIRTIVELLEKKLPPYSMASLPSAIDFVGDIAIIEIPPELDTYKSMIGEAILQAHRKVRTVLAKASAISGTYRLREFSVIAGEPKTTTIHRENHCQYYVDLAKAYFSPRLSYEHSRVASLVKEGETIVDLFAGVGPFAIQIAKTHENVKVCAVDVNPDAVELLKRNVRLNRVEGKVHPILGDAKQVVEKRLTGIADRVIMNLPEKALEFVEAACQALTSEGGIVHFYSFVSGSDSLENVKLRFANEVDKCGRKVRETLFSRFVRETAPYQWQVVFDERIL
jgi:tRNA (guanine37-N1)-methyltransferase